MLEIKDWLYILGIVVSVALGILGAYPGIRKSKADTILTLSNSIDGLAERVKDLESELFQEKASRKKDKEEFETAKGEFEARINFLEKELRRYVIAYGKVVNRIKQVDPDWEIPPLEDTNPKIKRV